MLMLLVGFLFGVALVILFYHFHVLKQFRTWGHDWRARAISAEQEVENWKVFAKARGVNDPFRR